MAKKQKRIRIMIIQDGRALLDKEVKPEKNTDRYRFQTNGGIKFHALTNPSLMIGTAEEMLVEAPLNPFDGKNGYNGYAFNQETDRFLVRARLTVFRLNYCAMDVSFEFLPPMTNSVLPASWFSAKKLTAVSGDLSA